MLTAAGLCPEYLHEHLSQWGLSPAAKMPGVNLPSPPARARCRGQSTPRASLPVRDQLQIKLEMRRSPNRRAGRAARPSPAPAEGWKRCQDRSRCPRVPSPLRKLLPRRWWGLQMDLPSPARLLRAGREPWAGMAEREGGRDGTFAFSSRALTPAAGGAGIHRPLPSNSREMPAERSAKCGRESGEGTERGGRANPAPSALRERTRATKGEKIAQGEGRCEPGRRAEQPTAGLEPRLRSRARAAGMPQKPGIVPAHLGLAHACALPAGAAAAGGDAGHTRTWSCRDLIKISPLFVKKREGRGKKRKTEREKRGRGGGKGEGRGIASRERFPYWDSLAYILSPYMGIYVTAASLGTPEMAAAEGSEQPRSRYKGGGGEGAPGVRSGCAAAGPCLPPPAGPCPRPAPAPAPPHCPESPGVSPAGSLAPAPSTPSIPRLSAEHPPDRSGHPERSQLIPSIPGSPGASPASPRASPGSPGASPASLLGIPRLSLGIPRLIPGASRLSPSIPGSSQPATPAPTASPGKMLNVMDFSCPDPLYSKYEESCEMKTGDLQGLGQPEQQLLAEADFLGGKSGREPGRERGFRRE